ncbi:MAG TPA: hypothetical protein PKV21_03520 [bacterium]|nr:hypothetical protein [bacterium]
MEAPLDSPTPTGSCLLLVLGFDISFFAPFFLILCQKKAPAFHGGFTLLYYALLNRPFHKSDNLRFKVVCFTDLEYPSQLNKFLTAQSQIMNAPIAIVAYLLNLVFELHLFHLLSFFYVFLLLLYPVFM